MSTRCSVVGGACVEPLVDGQPVVLGLVQLQRKDAALQHRRHHESLPVVGGEDGPAGEELEAVLLVEEGAGGVVESDGRLLPGRRGPGVGPGGHGHRVHSQHRVQGVLREREREREKKGRTRLTTTSSTRS